MFGFIFLVFRQPTEKVAGRIYLEYKIFSSQTDQNYLSAGGF